MKKSYYLREERKPTRLVVTVKEGPYTHHGVCGNVSEGGCMIRLNRPISPKAKVHVILYTQDPDGGLKTYSPFSTIVRWSECRRVNTRVYYYTGMQFEGLVEQCHGIPQVLCPDTQQRHAS